MACVIEMSNVVISFVYFTQQSRNQITKKRHFTIHCKIFAHKKPRLPLSELDFKMRWYYSETMLFYLPILTCMSQIWHFLGQSVFPPPKMHSESPSLKSGKMLYKYQEKRSKRLRDNAIVRQHHKLIFVLSVGYSPIRFTFTLFLHPISLPYLSPLPGPFMIQIK